MAEKEVFLTPQGRRKLEEELNYLITVKRPEIAEQIRAAKGEGDIMESAGYDEAKAQQAFLEGRILTIQKILENAVMIDDNGPSELVRLGSYVTVIEGDGEPETFRIVGSAEANPADGLISNESPVGRALLNHRVGDEVIVQTPGGTLRLRIAAIR